MNPKQTEIRTPNQRLLLGVAQSKNGQVVLEVRNHGKTDYVEVSSLISLLSAL